MEHPVAFSLFPISVFVCAFDNCFPIKKKVITDEDNGPGMVNFSNSFPPLSQSFVKLDFIANRSYDSTISCY